MNVVRGLIALALGGTGALSSATQMPVCDNLRYGSAAQALAIEEALQVGSVEDSRAAVRAAQRTRGLELGCPELAYRAGGASRAAPMAAQIEGIWELHRASAAEARARYLSCPPLGREAGTYALGGWLGHHLLGGFDAELLREIAEAFEGVQYRPQRTPGQLATWPGMFGYSERFGRSGDDCRIAGVVGEGVARLCADVPELCPRYARGANAGERFGVGDYLAARGLRDGGAGFDQGWAGVMMIEAALGATDPAQSQRFADAARLAGDWAVHEPAVRNHNYTAKLIWLLAALYDWTGEDRYRDALIDKLERSLLPGVLMDEDSDGEIDGLPGLRFADLRSPPARRPGRMWDAHNALPWYQAMNAWAAVEAFAAFRSRGDSEWAERVRPYAMALMDNLAAEVAPGADFDTGAAQIAFAMATGLWKFADTEGLPRPQWESALWSVWNAGLADAPGHLHTATVALVVARSRGVAYPSYRERAQQAAPASIDGLWFDPARSGEGLSIYSVGTDRLVGTWYTFAIGEPSRQRWWTFDGRRSGNRFEGRLQQPVGARFDARPWQLPESFDAGTLQILFNPDGSAVLDFLSSNSAEGPLKIQLRRLLVTRPEN